MPFKMTHVRRLTLFLLGPTLVAFSVLFLWTPAQAVVDKDCSDFATQADAQAFFLANGGPASDPHLLDGDGDGIACESNPCPCSYDTTPTPSPSPTVTASATPTAAPTPTVTPSPTPTATPVPLLTLKDRAKIVRVVDGDTVKVRFVLGGKRATVRLLGIDTPEVYGGTECGGPEASRAADRLLPKGTRVLLTSDASQDRKDRYGRLLRYIKSGKVDINRRLIHDGFATVYVYNHHPFERVKSYRKAQKYAHNHNLGLWSHCR